MPKSGLGRGGEYHGWGRQGVERRNPSVLNIQMLLLAPRYEPLEKHRDQNGQ